MLDLSDKRILVTGGNGFIGHAVVENLIHKRKVPERNIFITNSKEHDLREKNICLSVLKDNNIDVVVHLAAMVGGVGFTSKFPATQYYNNVLIDLQMVESAREAGVEKVVLVSSSCAYPKDAPYPLREESLWGGLPQETNRAYGISKRVLGVQAEAYTKQYGMNVVVVIPNNAYGPYDNFHPEFSHVIPSLIRKCLSGENPLVVWGDGTPTRDFLYVKDFAEGVLLAAEKLAGYEPVNLGSGKEVSIKELVALVRKLTGHNQPITFDKTKPNGQPTRSVDITQAVEKLGFHPEYTLEAGLRETIEWYKTTTKHKINETL